MNDGKHHYGRYQIAPNKRTRDTVELFLEVAEDVGESIWLPVCDITKTDPFPVAYLHFKRIGPLIFQLAGARPGHGCLDLPRSQGGGEAKVEKKLVVEIKGGGEVEFGWYSDEGEGNVLASSDRERNLQAKAILEDALRWLTEACTPSKEFATDARS